MSTYCQVCGSERKDEWTGEYDVNTGQKKMRQVCPVNPCEHTGHDLKRIKKKCGITLALFGADSECSRCGKKFYFD